MIPKKGLEWLLGPNYIVDGNSAFSARTKKIPEAEQKERQEKIAKEQKMKASYIARLNVWLERKGYDFDVINYSAPGFRGTREDNERMLRTGKFLAKNLNEYAIRNL